MEDSKVIVLEAKHACTGVNTNERVETLSFMQNRKD